MGNFFRLVCFLVLFSCRLTAEGYEISFQEKDWDSHTFLLSFPRSGNTWMRYCLEFLTKRPTIRLLSGFEKIDHRIPEKVILDTVKKHLHLPINNHIPLGVDYSRPPILKVHFFTEEYPIQNFPPTSTAILILMVRNPKECLLRERNIQSVKDAINNKNDDNKFFQNLRVYQHWNPERKKIIYYEDFISNPEQVLGELLAFLGEKEDYLSELMKDYEFHRQNCIQHYSEMGHKSYSNGEDLLYHSKEASIEEKLEIDNLIQQKFPLLWKNYLSRYAEK